ncbi:MAG: hypothetical protein HY812_13625 [Planctomycetes bacterium]|nr:hypothetical protein [Planctomycetota bacterium]
MTPAQDRTNAALCRAVRRHFDPQGGSPFWLERERALGLCALAEVREAADLARFGPFDREELLCRPLFDFVPRSLWRERAGLVLAESGGTTGRPTRSVFTQQEFEEAFGAPFLAAGSPRGFPRGGGWLFIGPSGPHVIGQAARLLARLHGSLEPFSVDLDPRWARAQAPGSLGERLYREHVLSQALDVMERERPEVIFATPPLALELARALPRERREAVRGVHLGGMAMSGATYAEIRGLFPRALVLPGYGNSMFGLLMEARAPQADAAGALHLDYFPLAGRLLVTVVADGPDGADLSHPLPPGGAGRVVLSRLDESFFLPNLVERDQATAIAANAEVTALGFAAVGVRDPEPLVAEQAQRGLY